MRKKTQLKNIISKNRTYYVSNEDLKLDASVPGHEVIVIRFSNDKKRVLVKTITSLEGKTTKDGRRTFKHSKKDLIQEIYDGNIIVIPNKYINTPKLSGIYTKGIWVDVSKLKTSRYKTRYPKEFKKIIEK